MVGVGTRLQIARAGLVRTAAWALFPLVGACAGEGGGGTGGSSSDGGSTSSTHGSTSEASTSTSNDASSSGGSAGSSSGGSSSSDGADGSSSTTEGTDTLGDGCWDYEFSGYYSDEPDWEAFDCPSLPVPCPAVDVFLWSTDKGLEPDPKLMTPEDIAAADAATRCVIEALRDGTEGAYELRWDEGAGQYTATTRYFVLPTGIVGRFGALQDLGKSAAQGFREPRAAADYDNCLSETDLVPLLSCVAADPASQTVASIPGFDPAACIDAAPECPPA